ncbi:acyl carrier protein [Micromonospora rubida]
MASVAALTPQPIGSGDRNGLPVEVKMSDLGPYEQVIGIVRRVLQIDAVDPRADFFDLGASSLALLQIVELVQEECAVSVSVTDIFDAPDVDSFASLVADRFSPVGQLAD